MKNKKLLLIAILALAIGFATVSTVLYITGNTGISTNLADYDVYFSALTMKSTDDGDSTDIYDASISTDKKTLTFTSNTLKVVGDKSILTYEVKNDSFNYDADVQIACKINNADSNDIISVTKNPTSFTVTSQRSATGTITVELKKLVEEEIDINLTCTLIASAVERDSLGEPEAVLANAVTYTNTNCESCTSVNDALDDLFDKLN